MPCKASKSREVAAMTFCVKQGGIKLSLASYFTLLQHTPLAVPFPKKMTPTAHVLCPPCSNDRVARTWLHLHSKRADIGSHVWRSLCIFLLSEDTSVHVMLAPRCSSAADYNPVTIMLMSERGKEMQWHYYDKDLVLQFSNQNQSTSMSCLAVVCLAQNLFKRNEVL